MHNINYIMNYYKNNTIIINISRIIILILEADVLSSPNSLASIFLISLAMRWHQYEPIFLKFRFIDEKNRSIH